MLNMYFVSIIIIQDDCIVIPQKARMYAQVAECPAIRDMSILRPIKVTEDVTITFPEKMTTCSLMTNADHELLLDELLPDVDFKRLSGVMKIFE